jgi:hypothetical protein
MRDQDGLVTYTYVFSEQTGKFVFLCDSIGYGVPYATQFTSPQKLEERHPEEGCGRSCEQYVVPQADPNGVYAPSSAEGTWILCKEPNTNNARPQYIEPKIATFSYKLDPKIVLNP